MQLLLAYAFDRETGSYEVPARLERAADLYRSLWRVPVNHEGIDAHRVGLHVWDAADSPWRWPSWQANDEVAIATLYLPLGYERVIGDVAPELAAVRLATALFERHDRVLELTPPFVIASLEPPRTRLRLQTDALGIGRLFEMRFPEGWVWSNRPAAACRFAGIRAEADRDGWRSLAASGWFIGDRTPFARLFAVPGGTTIEYDPARLGRISSRIDALAAWSSRRGSAAMTSEQVDAVADAVVSIVRSLDRISPAAVTADLSGGRDSRLVAAAAIAAGLNVTLNTGGADPVEADVAERLVAALPAEAATRVSHRVTRPTVHGPARTFGLRLDQPVVPNVMAWHRFGEGLRSPTFLPTTAPSGLAPGDHITLGGAGGEVGHGQLYPGDYGQFEDTPWADRLDALAAPLGETMLDPWGASAAARATAMERVRRTLEAALVGGLGDASVLDYFYAAERLRRWGTTAERCGAVSPLLVPEFIRTALSLTPDERRHNALHRAVTARLVPSWKDEPYYRRGPRTVAPTLAPRLGVAVDRDVIGAIVKGPSDWVDGYDASLVAQSWRSLLDGRGRPADERLMQRVLWRAVFSDYLADVNSEASTPRIEVREQRPRPLKTVARGRRLMARGLRKVARIVEPHG